MTNTDIVLNVTGNRPIHGLKSIQTYINLFPDFVGTLAVNGVDCGDVNRKTLGWLVNQGLQNTLECTRCGHKWLPRTQEMPRFCPDCNSPYWNKPRKVK
ncbi:MAG: hypothetical protein PHU08_00150 [Dehalococcoidales bacterium]|nr:hypothetical protein [Dehalococcoidales bacterium]